MNFLARSFTLSSSVKPVIIPFILESARGDLFPDCQLRPIPISEASYHAISSAFATWKEEDESLPNQDRNEDPWLIGLIVSNLSLGGTRLEKTY